MKNLRGAPMARLDPRSPLNAVITTAKPGPAPSRWHPGTAVAAIRRRLSRNSGRDVHGRRGCPRVYDYGPEFDRGIISKLPPVPTGRAYPTLVPKVNWDGTDIAGVRLPDIAVPLGTCPRWNLMASTPRDEYSAMALSFRLRKAKRSGWKPMIRASR
jgi:hypothetical protein